MIHSNVRGGDFTGLADSYDRYRTGYSRELFDVLEQCGIRRGTSVLDAGCGTGLSAQPLVVRGAHITGLDPSAEMLAAAERNLPSAKFVAGTVEELPFADRHFDAAICAQAFHWFDAERAFAELMRVVKPGGPVAIWWKVLGTDEPIRALRAAACARAGVTSIDDPYSGGFRAFYRAPFAERRLRVISFTARLTIEEWLGYEQSRATARNAYGDRHAAYLAGLREELIAAYGQPSARMDVRYTQYLYVGSTART
jgi:ubiquinone/menaquinone biosynthesis C-methylase UbiE